VLQILHLVRRACEVHELIQVFLSLAAVVVTEIGIQVVDIDHFGRQLFLLLA
jgi:hypothetical protein